jgi:hypothetical protein
VEKPSLLTSKKNTLLFFKIFWIENHGVSLFIYTNFFNNSF